MNTKNKYKQLFEGRFTKTIPEHDGPAERFYYAISPSTHGEKKLFQMVSRYARKKKNTILDVGCGGGHIQLVQYGKVYGVDISRASLKNAKKIYAGVKEADVSKKIPFKNVFFDIVFSSEVFGHIEKGDKDSFLKEIDRVLKPGGLMIFSIETFGKNMLTDWLKRNGMYKKYWIDYHGHIGLETPEQTVARIAKHFTVLHYEKTSSHLLPIDGYLTFREKYPALNVLENNSLRRLANLIESPFFFASLAGSPFNSGNDIIVVARKDPSGRK